MQTIGAALLPKKRQPRTNSLSQNCSQQITTQGRSHNVLEDALGKAIQEESGEVVDFLLRQGAKVQETFLRRAADTGDATKVEALLQHAADTFSQRSREQVTIQAINNKHVRVVEKLLVMNAVDPNFLACPAEGRVLIHHVAKHSGNTSQVLIKVLSEKRADLNALDKKGKTPLFYAAESNNHWAVKALIRYGADPNIKDHNRVSPLFWACHCGHLEAAQGMKGADPNDGNENDKTPLHEACSRGDREMITWLVDEAGANPQPWSIRETPFECAVRKSEKHDTKPSFLIQAGLDPWQKNMLGANDCDTALHTIVRMRETTNDDLRVELMKDLLSCVPAMVHAKNILQDTALHWATLLSTKVIEYLVENAGADMSVKNGRGRSPLIFATLSKQFHSVESLLLLAKKKTVDVIDATDKEGWTALHWAVFLRCEPIIELFLKSRANCNVLTDSERLPLHFVGYPFSDVDVKKDVCVYSEYDVTRVLTTPPCEAWKSTCEEEEMDWLVTLLSRTNKPCSRDEGGNLPFFMAAVSCHLSETYLIFRACAKDGLFGPGKPKKRSRRGNRQDGPSRKKTNVVPETLPSAAGMEQIVSST